MIPKALLANVLYDTICRATCHISKDVHAAFETSIATETSEHSRKALSETLESLDLSAQRNNLACPDTGWPLFFIKLGNECALEGGIMAFEDLGREQVARATKDGFLRSTMKDPFDGTDPRTNVGMNIPHFTYKFVPGDSIQISFAAKGGGSECFGGTRHRVVAFADGIPGIKKFVIDSHIAATRAGAICPPSVLGVGIGGTANIAANLAKEAACLRTVGSRHAEPRIAQLEEELTDALNGLGIGAMGAGGSTSVFAVNVEYAFTHIAGIALATSSNCLVARRATTRVGADGAVERLDNPNWFEGR